MHILVVGAGASGMGAAIMLARHGCKVTLCEAGPRVAPLLRGFSRCGHHFDTGLHCAGTLRRGEALWRYLNMLGVLPRLGLVPMRPDCAELFRFADGDICMPSGLDASACALSEIWPEHREAIFDFMRVLRERFLHSPFTNPENTSMDFAVLDKSEGAHELLESYGLPLRLASIVMAHGVYMGVKPRDAAMADFALVSYSMSEGMHTVRGGGAAVASAFEAEMAALDVKVLTGLAVKKINVAGGAASSVTCSDGRVIDCDAVVYTGHPRLLPGMLPEGSLRPSMARHLFELEDTGSCISVYGLTSSSFVDGRFVYLCGSDDLNDAFTACRDEKTWITLSAGDTGADGKRPVVANMVLPAGMRGIIGDVSNWQADSRTRPEKYAEAKNSHADWVAARLRALCPELADFELITASTDYSMRQWVYGSTGSVYGVLHGLRQMPVLPRTKVPNLVLAGQGVILPGLLGALVSSAVASGMLVGFEKVFEDFRNV